MFALNAQFGVGAGGKRGKGKSSNRACVLRALSNGMENPTLFAWRPVLVRDSLDYAYILETDPVRIRREPVLRCVKPCKKAWAKACGVGTGVLDSSPGAVCSVACLEW